MVTLSRPLFVALLLSVVSVALSAQDSLPGLVKRIKPSVVLVVIYDAGGSRLATASGFCVAPGQVVTNHHVVSNAARIEVHTGDDGVYRVITVAAKNEQADLAVLRIDATAARLRPLPVARTLPEEGERIIVIGNPRGLEGSVSDGIVSSVRTLREGKLLQITAPISPGSSGSPVVNMRGEVVGVATGANERGQNLNFAISVESVVALVPSASRVATTEDETIARKRAEKLILQGFGSAERKDDARALRYFEQATREDPSWVDAWLTLGTFQALQHDHQAAVKSLQRALELGVNPDREADLHKTLARSHFRLKQYKQAAENYKQAVRFKPDDADSFYFLGESLIEVEQHAEAVNAFKSCLSLKPNYPDANFELGRAYLSASEFAEAAAVFRKEVRLNPRNQHARFGLAFAYHNLGDKDSALSEYENLRRLDPKLAKELLEVLIAK